MKFIVHTRCKQKLMCGERNLPAMTPCEGSLEGIIRIGPDILCYTNSYTGHKYFCRDDDNQGMLRGKLTTTIQKTLQKRDKEYQDRWNLIWQDELCKKYKRTDHTDWLWNNDFYNADIDDLKHIAKLLNIKEV